MMQRIDHDHVLNTRLPLPLVRFAARFSKATDRLLDNGKLLTAALVTFAVAMMAGLLLLAGGHPKISWSLFSALAVLSVGWFALERCVSSPIQMHPSVDASLLDELTGDEILVLSKVHHPDLGVLLRDPYYRRPLLDLLWVLRTHDSAEHCETVEHAVTTLAAHLAQHKAVDDRVSLVLEDFKVKPRRSL